MDTKINIYLSFNGRCREAMTFYKECFGGELTFQTFEGSPMESLSPNGNKQLILHSTLIKDNLNNNGYRFGSRTIQSNQ